MVADAILARDGHPGPATGHTGRNGPGVGASIATHAGSIRPGSDRLPTDAGGADDQCAGCLRAPGDPGPDRVPRAGWIAAHAALTGDGGAFGRGSEARRGGKECVSTLKSGWA